jgi:hypothetical protein
VAKRVVLCSHGHRTGPRSRSDTESFLSRLQVGLCSLSLLQTGRVDPDLRYLLGAGQCGGDLADPTDCGRWGTKHHIPFRAFFGCAPGKVACPATAQTSRAERRRRLAVRSGVRSAVPGRLRRHSSDPHRVRRQRLRCLTSSRFLSGLRCQTLYPQARPATRIRAGQAALAGRAQQLL